LINYIRKAISDYLKDRIINCFDFIEKHINIQEIEGPYPTGSVIAWKIDFTTAWVKFLIELMLVITNEEV
jgi:hypothetical protein